MIRTNGYHYFLLMVCCLLFHGTARADDTPLNEKYADGDPSQRFYVVGVITGNVEIAVLFDKKTNKSVTLETGKRIPGMPGYFLKQAKRRDVVVEKVGDHGVSFRLNEAATDYRYAEVEAETDTEQTSGNFLEKFYRKFATGELERGGGLQVNRFAPYTEDTSRSRFDIYAPERYLTPRDVESVPNDYDGLEGETETEAATDELPPSYDFRDRYRGSTEQDSWLSTVTEDYRRASDSRRQSTEDPASEVVRYENVGEQSSGEYDEAPEEYNADEAWEEYEP